MSNSETWFASAAAADWGSGSASGSGAGTTTSAGGSGSGSGSWSSLECDRLGLRDRVGLEDRCGRRLVDDGTLWLDDRRQGRLRDRRFGPLDNGLRSGSGSTSGERCELDDRLDGLERSNRLRPAQRRHLGDDRLRFRVGLRDRLDGRRR